MNETTIVAGSSAFNLAGDVKSRGVFMKNTIIHMVVSGASKKGLGTGIVRAHSMGPATTYRRFAKWAELSGYNTQVGNYEGLAFVENAVSQPGFDFMVPTRTGYEKRILTFAVGAANLTMIAAGYLYKNFPAYRNMLASVEQVYATVYTYGYPSSAATGELRIKLTNAMEILYTPPFNINIPNTYAYLYYEERLLTTPQVTDSGWLSGSTPPDTTGYSGTPAITNVSVNGTKTVRTQVSYSDATPGTDDTTTSTEVLPFTKTVATYNKTTYEPAGAFTVGKNTLIVVNKESLYTIGSTVTTSTTNEVLAGGATKTTTTTTTTPVLDVYWTYRTVTTVTRDEKWEPLQIAIYPKGQSVYGDSVVFPANGVTKKFFPVIPVRRFNQMVNLANFPTQYAWNRKAARKAFSSKKKYDELLVSLANNPNLDAIDHAWVVFGVALGTQQQDGKNYIYEFFKNLADAAPVVLGSYRGAADFEAAWAGFYALVQASTNDESGGLNRPAPPTPQQYSFNVAAVSGIENWQYNVNISGKGGKKVVGFGWHPQSAGKVGHCWAYIKSSVSISVPTYVEGTGGDAGSSGYMTYNVSTTDVVAFGKQLTAALWEEYEFFDLIHTNNVFEGTTVTTLANKALITADENSGFLIPIHEGVFGETGLVRRTQLSLECAYIVMNYYDKQTIPWYATGIFQIVVVIIIIIVAVYTGYIDFNTVGLLGTAGAVGTTLGFTGTAAIIAGAIANALAAAIVAALISKAATSIFGDTWGKIIAVVATLVLAYMSNPSDSFSMSDAWTEATKADNLIKMTMSGLQEYGNYMQGQAQGLNMQTQKLQNDYKAMSDEITKLTSELLSGSGVDPAMIAEATRYAMESPEQFLSRTNMTGTEIAETSIKLVEDFPGPQMKLPYLDD